METGQTVKTAHISIECTFSEIYHYEHAKHSGSFIFLLDVIYFYESQLARQTVWRRFYGWMTSFMHFRSQQT